MNQRRINSTDLRGWRHDLYHLFLNAHGEVSITNILVVLTWALVSFYTMQVMELILQYMQVHIGDKLFVEALKYVAGILGGEAGLITLMHQGSKYFDNRSMAGWFTSNGENGDGEIGEGVKDQPEAPKEKPKPGAPA